MGLIENLMGFVFWAGVQSTVWVFRKNSEKSDIRSHVLQQAALTQFDTEFRSSRSGFDRFIDGVNCLPRPLVCWAFLSRRWWIPFGLPIARRACRLCLNLCGGYLALFFPFILGRFIKAKALKYVPNTCKNRPKALNKPFKQTR